jgi:hypothetical protein
VGGRGRDISRMKGGREREEQRWGMRRVGQLIRIYIDLLTTRIQDDGQVEEDTCYANKYIKPHRKRKELARNLN